MLYHSKTRGWTGPISIKNQNDKTLYQMYSRHRWSSPTGNYCGNLSDTPLPTQDINHTCTLVCGDDKVPIMDPINFSTPDWDTYFQERFAGDWKNVVRLMYSLKMSYARDTGHRTWKRAYIHDRWIPLQNGMMLDLNHDIEANLDETFENAGIPVKWLVMHVLCDKKPVQKITDVLIKRLKTDHVSFWEMVGNRMNEYHLCGERCITKNEFCTPDVIERLSNSANLWVADGYDFVSVA